MLLFTAEQAMHQKHQKIGFAIPNATARTYIFLHFINPVTIYLNDVEINTSSNACIIFTPGSNLHYQAKKIEMYHNFLHFNVANDHIFEELNLPLNHIFYTNLQDEITNAVELVEVHMIKKHQDYINIIDNIIYEMFSAVAKEQRRRIPLTSFSTQTRFDDLRTLIYKNPGEWSVDAMSKYVFLSRSRFSTKYKKIFGVPPNKDLMDAAMLYANKMLSTSDVSVADLASECGFTSPDYFIRLYKKNYGTTPGAYRKSLRANEEKD